ncbi:DUF6262 family protein [Arthrobacter castelli]|uniref:DUF6262 family protein n=1 Tax=Arthrobacter castelli TaxID=271431 RepID=UPI0012DF37F0|nr:DUF6262 family protein [Arthrobacter castelli]
MTEKSSGATDPAGQRTSKLIAAKRADSQRRRAAVLKTVEMQTRSGQPVTVAGVARAAGVSTWLIYNVPDLLAAVRRAMAESRGNTAGNSRTRNSGPSPASLHNEVALLNARLTKVTAERDQLKKALKARIGAQLELETPAELKTHIANLERSLKCARLNLEEAETNNDLLHDKLEESQDQLRAAQRINKMLITENSGKAAVIPLGSPH